MDNSFFQKFLLKIGVAILLIALVDLAYVNYWILQNSKQKVAEDRQVSNNLPTSGQNNLLPSPISTPIASINSQTTSIAPTPTPTTIIKEQTTVQNQTVIQTAQKEIFIPIGDGLSSNNSYTNLPGVQVTIDSSKYTGIASVVFEANIYVTGGNGKMYTQLYNSTAGRPVWFSELSTSSSTGTLVTSSPITLDKGQNTYAVQAKTDLTGYPANVLSSRIHITLK